MAAQVAELETVGRRRIGQLIGDTAAMNAELIAEDVPGGSRFHLVVPMGDVPPEQSSSITSILVGLGVGYPA